MRQAGILMPVFSLPSPYGIGTMGRAAREFILFLEAAGQRYWQTLPLGPTSYGDSPYQSFSSRAGNPYFIDLDLLAEEGLLEGSEYRDLDWGPDPERVDYGLLYQTRYPVLRMACRRLLAGDRTDFDRFCLVHEDWLEDYALFMAIKDSQGGVSWSQWPEGLRLRCPKALEKARRELAEDVAFWKAVQFLFFRQWMQVRNFAHAHHVEIIGDLPIYVSYDSADVWASSGQFQLDGDLLPTAVAGCPPDGFSEDGQLWGNPLFRWDRMKEEGYRWWVDRVAFQFRLYDVLRIDHFRGFDEYYAIPYGEDTARNGTWLPGPGLDFFRAVAKRLGRPRIIAEDLGFLTESVYQLLKDTGFPGMKVLQFAFDPRDTGSGYLPHCYTPHCVAYTGTHDNDTIQGWMATAPVASVRRAKRYLRLTKREGYHWGMMRGIWASVADLAVVQAQDLLGLGNEARINVPSTVGTNWLWRTLPGSFPQSLARKLRGEMELYGRLEERERADQK